MVCDPPQSVRERCWIRDDFGDLWQPNSEAWAGDECGWRGR